MKSLRTRRSWGYSARSRRDLCGSKMPPNPAVNEITVLISRAPPHQNLLGAYSLRRHGLYLRCCCEGYTPFQSIGSRRVRGGGRQDRYNGTTLRLAALNIRTYDDCVFNASRKRGPGGPDDLAGRKYDSRTRLDIGKSRRPLCSPVKTSTFIRENSALHYPLLRLHSPACGT